MIIRYRQKRLFTSLAFIGAIVVAPHSQLLAQGAVPARIVTANPAPSAFHAAAQQMLVRRRHPRMRWPLIRDVAASVAELYVANEWKPLWSSDGVPTSLASSVTRILADASLRGLSATDYDAAMLARQTRPTAPGLSDGDTTTAVWDVAMTADVLRFAHALRFGRVHVESVYPSLHLPRDTVDLAAFVQVLLDHAKAFPRNMSGSEALDTWVSAQFDTLEPPWAHYWLVRDALQQYQDYALGNEPLPSDLTPALVKDRIKRIDLALERWRWLPQTFTTAPIFINIPAFRLYAFGSPVDDGVSTLVNMDVAVGNAFRTRTPVFSALMRTVIFSPYWDVPRSITVKEVLPKARRDLGYLVRSHMEVVSVSDGRILPLSRSVLARVSEGTARIRQRPGADNALGGVKFVFPNDYNVYLHDTPTQSVFQLARRDVSHGCIRVAEPARLAAFVLRNEPEWTPARIEAAMHDGHPQQVTLTTPIPVFVVYTTVIARAGGETLFYDDIYGHDRALTARLAAGYPY
jgi:murein L,D-transpeptidase YcbB/YkuD